jgi:hypothetical protein
MSPYVIICRQCDVRRAVGSGEMADVATEMLTFLEAHGSHERVDITVDLTAGQEVPTDRRD